MKKTLSLCMIVKNEALFLEDCLKSAKPYVDEIIIIDTGSTDATKRIADQYADVVMDFPWINDFSAARNESIKHASCDWILILDADEEIMTGCGEVLQELIQNYPPEPYFIRIVNDISGPDTVEHYLIRLFPNHQGIFFEGSIHEQLNITDDKEHAASAQIKILHKGYKNEIVNDRDKLNRNLEMIKKQVEENPDDPFYLFNLGHTYMFTNELGKAADALGHCVKVMGKKNLPVYCVMVYTDLVQIRMMQRNVHAALSVIHAAPSKCHKYPDFMTMAGFAFLGAGQLQTAINFFTEATKLRMQAEAVFSDRGASSWRPWMGIARAYAEMGESELFLEALNKAKGYLVGKMDHPIVVAFMQQIFPEMVASP